MYAAEMVTIRLATPDDAASLMPWIIALNRQEHVETAEPDIRRALDRLLADPTLGGLWWIDRDRDPIGYAIVTFGYDLEFAGRDAYLTELFLAPEARGRGFGHAAIEAVVGAIGALEVRALHLHVRRDNASALALYRRAGFTEVPRVVMTRSITPS
jgi:ribosomal protein S18 acetylase RimI-like enzyme